MRVEGSRTQCCIGQTGLKEGFTAEAKGLEIPPSWSYSQAGGARSTLCQPQSLLGNTQHHLHNPRSKSRYFITSFFLFKSKLKINVPSVLRCISLVQPAHIPSRCPFQNMAGERRKEMDREREPVHPASMPVDCTSSKRETLHAWPHRRVERAQNAAGTRKSGRRARISSPASTLSCCRTLAKSHILSLLPFIVHNMAGVPSTAPTPWQLSSLHICLFLLFPFPLCGWPWALVMNTQALVARRAGHKS